MSLGGDLGSDPQAIASAFVTARRAARALPDFPGAIPETLDAAYDIQDAAIALDGRRIGGWKLGRVNPPHSIQLGTERLAGPIFDDMIHVAGDAPVVMPVFGDGFAAAEAEFLLRLGSSPDPAKRDWTIEEARALVDDVRVGIEIASSPLTAINDLGPTVTIADFGNNNGLVIGPPPPGGYDADLNGVAVALLIDGEEVGRGTTATMLDGPFGSLRFLLELFARRGRLLEAGQWISTGAVTGVHRMQAGAEIEARFGDELAVRCRAVAATR